MDSNKQHENEGVGKKKDNEDNNPQLRRYIAAHACPSLAAAPKTHIVLQFYQFETSRQELGDVTVVLPRVQLAEMEVLFHVELRRENVAMKHSPLMVIPLSYLIQSSGGETNSQS